MALPLQRPEAFEQYFDERGMLTPEGMQLFQYLIAYVEDLNARLEAGGL